MAFLYDRVLDKAKLSLQHRHITCQKKKEVGKKQEKDKGGRSQGDLASNLTPSMRQEDESAEVLREKSQILRIVQEKQCLRFSGFFFPAPPQREGSENLEK
ncbi:hypothetical protein NPIL_554311 [Nephila pilipes]|uniref:Uncharacterized protein n=1 Tax=Nephila pilipes TaxID=299642 RepID=A0A8X6I6T8_NEPPI|nr:hypothetical protein NPIL_554311 [Nephila pilipes]